MATERISPTQLLMLLVVSRVTIALVFLPAAGDPSLKQDLWLALLLGALWGIPFFWLLNRLYQRFPDRSFPEVLELVLGRWLGKVILLAYFCFYLLGAALNLRMAGEFFVFAFLPMTPIIVVLGVVALLSAWSAKAGIEVIARLSQIAFGVVLLSILLVFFMLLKEIQFERFQPIFLQSGFEANFKQMFAIVARTSEFLTIGILLPSLNRSRVLFRTVVLAQVIIGVIWTLMGIAVTGTLGLASSSFYFPFFSAARLISIADFLERVDALILASWTIGMFLRTGLILWANSVIGARLFGLKEHRSLVLPLAGLAVTYAVAQAEHLNELRGYLRTEIYTPLMLTFIFLIPMAVLTIAAIRGIRSTPGRPAPGQGRPL